MLRLMYNIKITFFLDSEADYLGIDERHDNNKDTEQLMAKET